MHTINIRPIRVGGLLLPSNVLMAPLAGYTCYPFRMLAYELGAGLCFTEMCSANALKYEDRRQTASSSRRRLSQSRQCNYLAAIRQ